MFWGKCSMGPRETCEADSRRGGCDVRCHSGVISHLQGCDQILFVYSTSNDRTGMKTCNGKFATWAFRDFSKDINILIFHRGIKTVKHAFEEGLQSFKAWGLISEFLL